MLTTLDETLRHQLPTTVDPVGAGYDGGWKDGKGLGVTRGEQYSESVVYDLADPDRVARPDGKNRTPMHRETSARVTGS